MSTMPVRLCAAGMAVFATALVVGGIREAVSTVDVIGGPTPPSPPPAESYDDFASMRHSSHRGLRMRKKAPASSRASVPASQAMRRTRSGPAPATQPQHAPSTPEAPTTGDGAEAIKRMLVKESSLRFWVPRLRHDQTSANMHAFGKTEKWDNRDQSAAQESGPRNAAVGQPLGDTIGTHGDTWLVHASLPDQSLARTETELTTWRKNTRGGVVHRHANLPFPWPLLNTFTIRSISE